MTRLFVLGLLLVTLPLARAATEWRTLFDGKSLSGWTPTPFGGAGEVEARRTDATTAVSILVRSASEPPQAADARGSKMRLTRGEKRLR
jgi:hypothetical protein